MATYYIDPVAGSNANAGTDINAPKRDFTSFSGAFVGGNEYLVKRGTTMTTNSGTRANVVATGTSANAQVYIGAYGTGANPVLDGNQTYYPIYIKSGTHIVVDGLDVTNTAGAGIILEATSANLDTCTVKNCNVYRVGTLRLAGTDGITITKALNGGTSSNILIENCHVWDSANHGIKARTGSVGVTIKNCTVRGCGFGSPAHGMGTAANRANPTSWTLISGNVYEAVVSTTNLLSTNNSSWALVYASGKNGYFHLTASATPLTPGAGEYGIGANDTVRINVGGDPTGTAINVYPTQTKNVIFLDCMVETTHDQNGVEGWGWQFDEGSINCVAFRCLSANNAGGGFSCNVSSNNHYYGCVAYNNKKSAYYAGGSPNCNVINCTLDALPGVDNVYYVFGATGVVKNNIILNGRYGVSAVSTGASVTDSYNCVYGSTTAYLNVTPGTGSITTNPTLGTQYIPSTNSTVYRTGIYTTPLVDKKGQMFNIPPSMGAYEFPTVRGAR